MQESINLFNKNGYVHLQNFLDPSNCDELTNILKDLVNQGQTVKDEQCPQSEAIHGSVTFDKLLEDLLPHFEKHSGKKLYPTCSYARLYKPGEELKVHRDRPSCEISVTLTLGFSGKQWPIYMGDSEDKSNASEILMNVGDAVLYRGMEKWHWRETFEGEWQAQVFLHYVDAEGPYAEWKYDKRDALGTHNSKNMIPFFVYQSNHLSNNFCDLAIQEYSKDEHEKEKPFIGENQGHVDLSIRDVERLMLDATKGIPATLVSFALNHNFYNWKYKIDRAMQAEYLKYDKNCHYTGHIDTFHCHGDNTRKLTALAFLNDNFEGGQFWINADGKKIYPYQKKGTVLVFPSYMLHGVEPVTSGVRHTVVTWLLGPYFN